MESPVLLTAFRRPDLTAQVLRAIRDARPSRLYAAVDGARPGIAGEAELVRRTVEAIRDGVDWHCRLELRVREQNLGCRFGVADAISWFLEHEPEGVILEDDCVPHPDFFVYCDELLARYRDDPRVFAVCGDNSLDVELTGPWSYGFIRYPNVWGWATWRRAWQHFDDDMTLWQQIRNDEAALRLALPHPKERSESQSIWNTLVDTGRPDTWDYRWSASCVLSGGLCAIPRRNMIENIGFGPDATHTTNAKWDPGLPALDLLPLVHPPMVVLDRPAELQVFLHGSDRLSGWPRWRMRLRSAARLIRSPARWDEFARLALRRLQGH